MRNILMVNVLIFVFLTFTMRIVEGGLWWSEKKSDESPNWTSMPTELFPEIPAYKTELKRTTGDYKANLIYRNDRLLVQMRVGTPLKAEDKDQMFAMYINIFSGKVFLPSNELCPDKKCNNEAYRVYSTKNSKSSFQVLPPQTDEFDDTIIKVKGMVFRDTFKFGRTTNEMIMESQEFIHLTISHHEIIGLDGMFGLGLETDVLSAPVLKLKTVLGNGKQVFGIYINKKPTTDHFGSLVIGGNDEGLFKQYNVVKHDVVQKNGKYEGWDIHIEKLVFIYKDQSRAEVSFPERTLATVSPDVDFIKMPDEQLWKAYHKMFDHVTFNHFQDMFPCEVEWKTQLPQVAFVFDGQEYVLDPEDYARPEHAKCRSYVTTLPDDKVVLGLPFMRKFYTRFHLEKYQLQFALSTQEL